MNSDPHRNLVFATIDGIARSSSLPGIAETLRDAAGKFGFTSFGINELPHPGEGANPLILTESTPSGFRECYIDERFYLADHICARARAAGDRRPFRFSEAAYPRTEARIHQRFLQALGTFGLGKGIVVPLGQPTNIPSCLWFAGPDPNLDDDAMRAMQMIALFAASMAHVVSRPPRRGSLKLTVREREVLTWAAQGKSAHEIGEILKITRRTVDEHVQHAILKLGASNRTHAVAVALREEIIRF
jgi:LuxR family quorum sensing-dependent transcriptional regulator